MVTVLFTKKLEKSHQKSLSLFKFCKKSGRPGALKQSGGRLDSYNMITMLKKDSFNFRRTRIDCALINRLDFFFTFLEVFLNVPKFKRCFNNSFSFYVVYILLDNPLRKLTIV